MKRGLLSAAVMNQRHEPNDSLEDFPTPQWATRALIKALREEGEILSSQTAWDPCCNRGFMAEPLREAFGAVLASDIHDYGYSRMDFQEDFLQSRGDAVPLVDWTCINPPFRLGGEFLKQALQLSRRGVAAFVRTNFLEGLQRYRTIYSVTPASLVMPFIERVVLWKGVLLNPDVHICRMNKDQKWVVEKPTTATSYSWIIFDKRHQGKRGGFQQFGPCRKELTRPGDYPALPDRLNPELILGPDWKTLPKRPLEAHLGSLVV